MYISKTITTKARPIKKVCIINEDDFANLLEVIKRFSSEVGGFLNLILINDAELFSPNSIEFIKYHDPDIIFNFSSCDNEDLSLNFNTYTVDGNKSDFDPNNFSMHLTHFNHLPGFPRNEFEAHIKNIYTRLDKEPRKEDLVYYVNFGLVEPDFGNHTRGSLFENINFINLDSFAKFFEIIFNTYKENLIFLSGISSLNSEFIDIWHVNNNRENFYNTNPSLIFGSNKDIKSMAYFWNMRATYTHNKNVWLPIELFDEYKEYLSKFSNFCIFSERDLTDFKTKILKANNGLSEIENKKYYFNSGSYGWELFQHTQNVSVINERFTLIHPPEKLFSHYFNLNIVLEVSGLDELFLPKSFKLGRLFKSPHTFSRVNFGRLAYDFASLEARSPYIDELNIPDIKTIFKAIFEEYGLKLEITPKSQITDQLINMFGYEELNILCDNVIYDLLVEMTPKRITRLAKEVTDDLHKLPSLSDDQIEKILTIVKNNVNKLNTIYSNKIVKASDLHGRKQSANSIQRLYELNILLRGKSFNCPLCNSQLWYPLSSIPDEIKCYYCNNFIKMPIYIDKEPLDDSFRLNELMVISVDQGVLPVLLTVNFLFNQRFPGKKFIFDYEVFEDSLLLGEIDIIFTLGPRLGIAEVKADSGFKNDQVDKLLNIAQRINANMILFSTIKKADSKEIKDLYDYIKEKNLNIPAFILTKEALFERKGIYLNRYFVIKYDDTFPKGPFIVSDPVPNDFINI